MATPETSELSLPDTEEDFLSWLAVSSDWFPEATASTCRRRRAPPAFLRLSQLARWKQARRNRDRPGPSESRIITASCCRPHGVDPVDATSPPRPQRRRQSGAAAHLRHAASGLSRMAASMWASLGMAHPAPAAPTLSSPELLRNWGARRRYPRGSTPRGLRRSVIAPSIGPSLPR